MRPARSPTSWSRCLYPSVLRPALLALTRTQRRAPHLAVRQDPGLVIRPVPPADPAALLALLQPAALQQLSGQCQD